MQEPPSRKPWHAAVLGLIDPVVELLGDHPEPETLSEAFWHARSGAQRRAAKYLLGQGADPNWVPDYADGSPLDAASSDGSRRENVTTWLRELNIRSARPSE